MNLDKADTPERVMRVVALHSSVTFVGLAEADPLVETMQGAVDAAGIDVKISATDAPVAEAHSPRSGQYVVCTYRRLIDFLQDVGTGSEKSFSDLLDEWLDQCRALLAFCRKSRRQVALVDGEALAASPMRLLVRALGQLNVDEDKLSSIEVEGDGPVAPEHDPILAILVDAATRSSPAIRQTAELLDAHSLTSQDASDRRNAFLEEAYRAYRDGDEQPEVQAAPQNKLSDEEAEKLRTALAGVQAENYLFREQETLLRAELDALGAACRRALSEADHSGSEAARLRKQLASLETEAQALRDDLSNSRTEIAVLRAENADLTAENEDRRAETDYLKSELKERTADAERLASENAELSADKAALSSEVSETLLVIEVMAQSGGNDVSVPPDASLSVRVERYLESLNLDLIRAQTETHAVQQANERLKKIETDLTAQTKRIAKQRDTAAWKVNNLTEKIEALQSSTSWRITGPIRTIAGRVSRKPKN